MSTSKSVSKGEMNVPKSIQVICPVCKAKAEFLVPQDIINEARNLVTGSIPAGLVCEHSFQVFLDKNSVIRGYQKVDFELNFQADPQPEVNELKELYEEFWDLIPDDHPEFQAFISEDSRRELRKFLQNPSTLSIPSSNRAGEPQK